MKFATALMSALSTPLSRGTGRALLRLGAVFLVAVAVFSVGFLWLMASVEGRDQSWADAVYWTLVTMTTLGYGDIVFESPIGQMYSLVVLLSGALLILILLPFTFVQLVYLPWRAAMREARIPRRAPTDMSDHVILTGQGPIEARVRRRAEQLGIPHVLVVEDSEEAAALHDDGRSVLVGALDSPGTFRAAGADRAAMALLCADDQANTNMAFTIREVSDAPRIVATAGSRDSVDVLELAGADRVLHLGDLLGAAFAARILAPTARSSEISRYDNLVIAEASAAGTDLVGRTLRELDLRSRFGVSVVGVWERGSLLRAHADARVEEHSILLLAGTRAQLDAYDAAFAGTPPAQADEHADEFVVILGSGRVGRAVGQALAEAGVRFRMVEQRPERVPQGFDAVIGDAADREVLRRAGIEEASVIVVTTHADDMNVYLTLYCRRLRPDAEVLGRVARHRNVPTMHRAGADFVLSYASVGAVEAWNAIQPHPTLLLAEGLLAFRAPMPEALAGEALRDSDVAATGCVVVGLVRNGDCITDVRADEPLPAEADLVLVGDAEAETAFHARYLRGRRGRRARARA